jgi:hypothetical protein
MKKNNILGFYLLSLVLFLISFCFAFSAHAELPTPISSSATTAQTGLYNPNDVQISLNTTQKAEYVMYHYDASQNKWMVSSSALGLNWTPVDSNLTSYYQNMKNQGWTGTFSYSDVNNYETITNNLKNKTENDGLNYLLSEIKTDAAEDLSYINTDQKIFLAREIKANPSNYTIVNGNLQVGPSSGNTTNSTGEASGSGTTQSNTDSNLFGNTTSGGDLSLPGGINISKPSSVKIGNLNVAYSTLFNVAIGVSGTVFIVMILVGGIWYLTAMGNEDVVTKSKRLLIDAVIGIVIVAAAWGVGSYVLSKLQIGSSTQGTTTLPQSVPSYNQTITPFPTPTGTIIETPEQFPGLPSPVMNIENNKGTL